MSRIWLAAAAYTTVLFSAIIVLNFTNRVIADAGMWWIHRLGIGP